MHLWNIKALADEINQDKLSEAESFKYFFVVTFLDSLSVFLLWLLGTPTPLITVPFGFVFPVIDLVIVAVGLIVCFRVFQQHDGHQFIQKFICLLLPANLRAFVYCLPLYLVAAMVASIFPSQSHHDVVVLSNSLIVATMIVVQFVLVYRQLIYLSNSGTGPERAAV